MRRLLFIALLLASPAAAQQANVVTACGSVAPFGPLVAGTQFFPTIDIHGQLCLAGGTTAAFMDKIAALQDQITEIKARLAKLEGQPK